MLWSRMKCFTHFKSVVDLENISLLSLKTSGLMLEKLNRIILIHAPVIRTNQWMWHPEQHKQQNFCKLIFICFLHTRIEPCVSFNSASNSVCPDCIAHCGGNMIICAHVTLLILALFIFWRMYTMDWPSNNSEWIPENKDINNRNDWVKYKWQTDKQQIAHTLVDLEDELKSK